VSSLIDIENIRFILPLNSNLQILCTFCHFIEPHGDALKKEFKRLGNGGRGKCARDGTPRLEEEKPKQKRIKKKSKRASVAQDTPIEIWTKEEKYWRPRTEEEVKTELHKHVEEVVLHDEENPHWKEVNEILNSEEIKKRLNGFDKSTPMRGCPAKLKRQKETKFKGKDWTVAFTDGSQVESRDGHQRAGWGLFRPQTGVANAREEGREDAQQACARVEGKQENDRAELCAILAALTPQKEHKGKVLIITDSESSIKLITNWEKTSNRMQRKTQNRDLIKTIVSIARTIEEVAYYHIYSHQNAADEERKAKINKQIEALNNDADRKAYQTFIKGSEAADELAKEATKKGIQEDNRRDWNKEPMENVDAFYIVRKIDLQHTLEDKPAHKWIKESTQKRIVEEQMKDEKKARPRFLKHMNVIDRKRSFAGGKRSNHKQHRNYIALFKLRMHASPTAKKTCRRAAFLNQDNPYKEFFKQMYPNNKCHACAKKHIDVVEDSEHMMKCPSRDDRNEASKNLWASIYKLIEEAENNGKGKGKAQNIRPFALRTTQSNTLYEAPANWACSPCLGRIAQFPDEAAALGLIPRDLVGALRELGLTEPESVADEVAQLCQNAVVADLYARHQVLAKDRDQKALFRKLVLGIDTP
jgi:ribonuclease HI